VDDCCRRQFPLAQFRSPVATGECSALSKNKNSMHHRPECVVEPWAGLFVAAYVTELAGGFYGYAKVYTSEPWDAWCPDALIKVGSVQCPCPVEALDSALERAFAAIQDMYDGRSPALWRQLVLRAAAGACV
jgi:hypothetical protein